MNDHLKLGAALAGAKDSPNGGAHVNASAAELQELGKLLQNMEATVRKMFEDIGVAVRLRAQAKTRVTGKRGRKPSAEDKWLPVFCDYWEMRAHGTTHGKALDAIQLKCPKLKNRDTIERMVRKSKYRHHIDNMDLWAMSEITPDQIAVLRKVLSSHTYDNTEV